MLPASKKGPLQKGAPGRPEQQRTHTHTQREQFKLHRLREKGRPQKKLLIAGGRPQPLSSPLGPLSTPQAR